MTGPTHTPSQGPKDLSGTWSLTHFDDRFQGWIALRQSGSALQGTWHTSSGKSEPDTLVSGSVDGTAGTLRRFPRPQERDVAMNLSRVGHPLECFVRGYFF